MSDIKKLKYLVYDEDSSQFSIMRMIMQQIGCTQLEFSDNPLKAMRLFEEHHFDMVIVTLRNTQEESWKFVTWLRSPKLTPKAGLPVLGLLTKSDNPVLISAIRKGVNYVALKPVSSAALSERITKTLTTVVKMTRTPNYYGPDRRRLPDKDYAGPDRRSVPAAADARSASA